MAAAAPSFIPYLAPSQPLPQGVFLIDQSIAQVGRTPEACAVCRAKKRKCDGVKPECGPCRAAQARAANSHTDKVDPCSWEQRKRKRLRILNQTGATPFDEDHPTFVITPAPAKPISVPSAASLPEFTNNTSRPSTLSASQNTLRVPTPTPSGRKSASPAKANLIPPSVNLAASPSIRDQTSSHSANSLLPVPGSSRLSVPTLSSFRSPPPIPGLHSPQVPSLSTTLAPQTVDPVLANQSLFPTVPPSVEPMSFNAPLQEQRSKLGFAPLVSDLSLPRVSPSVPTSFASSVGYPSTNEVSSYLEQPSCASRPLLDATAMVLLEQAMMFESNNVTQMAADQQAQGYSTPGVSEGSLRNSLSAVPPKSDTSNNYSTGPWNTHAHPSNGSVGGPLFDSVNFMDSSIPSEVLALLTQMHDPCAPSDANCQLDNTGHVHNQAKTRQDLGLTIENMLENAHKILCEIHPQQQQQNCSPGSSCYSQTSSYGDSSDANRNQHRHPTASLHSKETTNSWAERPDHSPECVEFPYEKHEKLLNLMPRLYFQYFNPLFPLFEQSSFYERLGGRMHPTMSGPSITNTCMSAVTNWGTDGVPRKELISIMCSMGSVFTHVYDNDEVRFMDALGCYQFSRSWLLSDDVSNRGYPEERIQEAYDKVAGNIIAVLYCWRSGRTDAMDHFNMAWKLAKKYHFTSISSVPNSFSEFNCLRTKGRRVCNVTAMEEERKLEDIKQAEDVIGFRELCNLHLIFIVCETYLHLMMDTPLVLDEQIAAQQLLRRHAREREYQLSNGDRYCRNSKENSWAVTRFHQTSNTVSNHSADEDYLERVFRLCMILRLLKKPMIMTPSLGGNPSIGSGWMTTFGIVTLESVTSLLKQWITSLPDHLRFIPKTWDVNVPSMFSDLPLDSVLDFEEKVEDLLMESLALVNYSVEAQRVNLNMFYVYVEMIHSLLTVDQVETSLSLTPEQSLMASQVARRRSLLTARLMARLMDTLFSRRHRPIPTEILSQPSLSAGALPYDIVSHPVNSIFSSMASLVIRRMQLPGKRELTLREQVFRDLRAKEGDALEWAARNMGLVWRLVQHHD